METGGCVYILTNKYNKVFYVGVTSDLLSRVYEHLNNVYPTSFSSRYKLYKLVYYKFYPTISEAINEEKRIKAGSRASKIGLINGTNPAWNNLIETELSQW